MKICLILLGVAMACGSLIASDPANASDVFAKTSETYKKLKSYEIEAETQIIVSKQGSSASYQYKTTLAADEQGRSYVENRADSGSELRVGNGSTTWKYVSAQKAWSKEELAQVSGLDDGESQDEPTPQDLFSQTARSFVTRYSGLARYSRTATYVKDDKLKFNGNKVLCHIYRVSGDKGASNDLWITDAGYFVARHIEKTQSSEIVTDYKRISVAQPEAALFDFQPPSSARQIANVLLPSERNVSLVGTSAADFTLKTLDGEAVHLSELHGKVVLLDFWASWCPPCRHELPTIAGLSRKLKDTNVVIFGINDEDGSKAKHFLETNHNELVTLHDGDRKVARMYSCYSIPTVFIIDPVGRIVGHYVGERDEQEFMASLRQAGMK